ncbi:DUF1800 family protein [Paraglaciecola aquimarina]|uniref:DUF1800 family protein n=1 Tax=Paraglaciecola aquimarina TaxID=1235557 RepID=A0ABU3SY42_9ALTE|nr:DUF1800 family protein [Paraglaciecola aquimarina]MDU0354918.1 DUF1800 family protein [Paraglaciecola aquimarina]
MSRTHAFIAANRFGYGANDRTIQQIKDQPQGWLLAQLSADIATHELQSLNTPWSSQLATKQLNVYIQQKKQEKKSRLLEQTNMMALASQTTQKEIDKQIRTTTNNTISHLIQSDNPFFWRLTDFFSNHFSVTGNGPWMRALAPTLELEAIVPNISGRFENMLLAVESHPAMLVYLNNDQSVGPNSKVGKRSKGRKGLNENLAREILELHTLGVNAGYSQTDVIELARAITGWGIVRNGDGRFSFKSVLHEL